MALNDKGLIGMKECLDYIEEHKADEGGVDITTKLYAKSAYYAQNLELSVKVKHANTTKYFRIDWDNPTEDDDEFPIELNAPENSAQDIFDLFMSIDDEMSPETHTALLWVFDAVCEKESKHYVIREAEDTGYKYLSKLEDEKEIEANIDGVLPFDYVERYNELDAQLETLTVYPPEEITTVDGMVERLRDINANKTIIVDIDYNLDGTMIVVQAEDNKSFMVSVDLIPDAELDEEEISVATYYLMAMFDIAAKTGNYENLSDIEIRQCIRMLLEFQSNSAADEVASSTASTTIVSSTSSTAGSPFRPATYDGVSKGTTKTPSGSRGKKSGKKNKDKSKKKGSAFPDYPEDQDGIDYSRSSSLFDDTYPYD